MATFGGKQRGAGRPKGSKDKISRNLKDRMIDVWNKLEKEKKGLHAVAKEDPKWFYVNFVKPMLPKDMSIEIDASEKFTEIIRKIVK